jgi:hypothetical protein
MSTGEGFEEPEVARYQQLEEEQPLAGEAAADESAEVSAGDEQNDAAGLIDRLRNINHKEGYLIAGTAVGAAAVAAGVLLAKHGHNVRNLRTPSGSRLSIGANVPHMENTVSLVEISGNADSASDLALSLPKSAEAAEKLAGSWRTSDLFAMGGKEKSTVHPLKGDHEHIDKYARATKQAASWLIHALKPFEKDKPAG